jgi:hypothetical protein
MPNCKVLLNDPAIEGDDYILTAIDEHNMVNTDIETLDNITNVRWKDAN